VSTPEANSSRDDAVPFRDVGNLDLLALERLGIKYESHEALSLSELDDDASRAVWNQARLGDPVNEEHVEEMLAELERGHEFPPIIFYRDDRGRAVTLSGNHRRQAYERGGRETIRAYEAVGLAGLGNDDERVLRLIYEANHGHGMSVATDDRVHQALALIQHGYNVRAAAAAVGIPESRVRDHYDTARATTRLEEKLGIDTSPIPISAQRRLVNIKNDRVLKAAAEIVPLMAKKTQEVNDLVRAVNLESTEKAQLAVIEDYAAALTTHHAAPRTSATREDGMSPEVKKLDSAIGTILRFDQDSLRTGIPTDYRERLATRMREALLKLSEAEALI